MAINMNANYGQFHKGLESIGGYGPGMRRDTRVKYESNTRDVQGNKVMDKMSKENTVKELEDISLQPYEGDVILELSNEGLAELIKSKKGSMFEELTEEQRAAKAERDAAFQNEIHHLEKEKVDMPEYSGIYEVDKAISAAVENCSKEEREFVYDIIRQNFLVNNIGDMTEEERLANISLGMKKAEYAANNFISEDKKKTFLDAMKNIAKLATAGKADDNGDMNYGVHKPKYLGSGSGLVATTDSLDMMKTMDPKAYEEYRKISAGSSNEDRPLNELRYLMNWYQKAINKNPNMVRDYENISKDYVKKNVKNQALDKTFDDIVTDSKSAFLESLKAFQEKNPTFLSSILNKEFSSSFWKK